MKRRVRECGKVDLSQASHSASQGQVWKPPGFPWRCPWPLVPPPALFSAPLSGQVPVTRLSHCLTPRLGAQPVGHSGLQLPVRADSGAWSSPVALMRFHHPACAAWRGAWDCRTEMPPAICFRKGEPPLSGGEPGGGEVRRRGSGLPSLSSLRTNPTSKPSAFTQVSQGAETRERAERINTEQLVDDFIAG